MTNSFDVTNPLTVTSLKNLQYDFINIPDNMVDENAETNGDGSKITLTRSGVRSD